MEPGTPAVGPVPRRSRTGRVAVRDRPESRPPTGSPVARAPVPPRVRAAVPVPVQGKTSPRAARASATRPPRPRPWVRTPGPAGSRAPSPTRSARPRSPPPRSGSSSSTSASSATSSRSASSPSDTPLPRGDDGIPTYPKKDAGAPESVGTIDDLNLEAIADLEPDLIVGGRLRAADTYDELSKIAPTVFSVRPGFTWKENHLLNAAALDRTADAKAQLANARRRGAVARRGCPQAGRRGTQAR